MFGGELILSAIFATFIMAQRGKRRAQAGWEQAQERAKQRSEARQQKAEEREQRWRQWFEDNVSKGPRSPLWWPYTGARLIGGGVAAGVAGAKGAREGFDPGSRERARSLAREAARRGVSAATVWREWKRQDEAQKRQNARKAHHDGQACACGENRPAYLIQIKDGEVTCVRCLRDRSWNSRRTQGGPRPGARKCRKCGTSDENLLTEHEGRVWCVPCLLTASKDADTIIHDDEHPPAAPVLVRCAGTNCGVPITQQVADSTGGYCVGCAAERETSEPHRGRVSQPPSGGDPESEPVDADIVDEPPENGQQRNQRIGGEPAAIAPPTGDSDPPEGPGAPEKEELGPEVVEGTPVSPGGAAPVPTSGRIQVVPVSISPRGPAGTTRVILGGTVPERDDTQQEPQQEGNQPMSNELAHSSGNGEVGSGSSYTALVSHAAQMAVAFGKGQSFNESALSEAAQCQVDQNTVRRLESISSQAAALVKEATDLATSVKNTYGGVHEEVNRAGLNNSGVTVNWAGN